MASLSTALNLSRSSLTTVAGRTALSSRNIANVGNADYSRKIALVSSLASGSIAISSYTRTADKLLLDKLLGASSNSAASDAVLNSIKQLSETVGDPESGTSPAGMMGKFQTALQTYEQNPSDQTLAQNAIKSAGDLVRSLNSATGIIQDVRKQADSGMSDSVDRINNLLQQFKVANDAVVRGSGSAEDLADNLDTRDKTMKLLSEEIGIRAVTRSNNDIALYTDSGVTLFETVARSVTMSPTTTMTAGVSGNAVYVDGVDVSSPSSSMAMRSGKLFGLAKVRDDIAVVYQSQMDEVARGLIETFSESDQSAVPTLANATGIFSYSGSPAVPTSGVAVAGLAGDIRLNPSADPAQGGLASRLRDGGLNGAAYSYNTSGSAGFSGRLTGLIDSLGATRGFDPATQLDAQDSLMEFGTATSGWLEAARQQASSASDLQTTMKSRSADALQRVNGVNIDDEMAVMLELERTYQASARLISTVDKMLESLLQATG
jgi:flagellar hook-associated protein 1